MTNYIKYSTQSRGHGAQVAAPRLKCPCRKREGSHARWQHLEGRATTISIHGNFEIGGWLFQEILKQLCITEDEFNQLR